MLFYQFPEQSGICRRADTFMHDNYMHIYRSQTVFPTGCIVLCIFMIINNTVYYSSIQSSNPHSALTYRQQYQASHMRATVCFAFSVHFRFTFLFAYAHEQLQRGSKATHCWQATGSGPILLQCWSSAGPKSTGPHINLKRESTLYRAADFKRQERLGKKWINTTLILQVEPN